MTTRTGVVLAGGFARRFGEADKTLAELDGEPLLAHAVAGLRPAVDEVVVSCREEQIPVFEAALDSSVGFCPDPTPDEGPLAGLAAALDAIDAEQVALATADMPCVPADLYRELFDALGDGDAVVIRDADFRQPAPAVYRTVALRTAVTRQRSLGDPRLRGVFDHLPVETRAAEWIHERWGERALADVNTPDELASLRK